jgi:glycosyltransferase involved in cell wall biosynthesis
MKVALVHELLTMKGGAENVLRILAEMFPDAPIYTLLYNKEKLGDWFPKERVRPSIAQPSYSSQLIARSLAFNHHLYLNKFPHAVEQWNFNDFDLVISSSSAFAHGIITNGKPKHLSYVHSPARYLWDQTHAVQQRAHPLTRWYLSKTFHKLRIWDAEAAKRADMILAASNEVQRRIELYWERESDVVYPPIHDSFFPAHSPQPTAHSYFLIVSTLARYKQIDLAINACNKIGASLKIVGEGPDISRLQRMAGPTVEFLGYRSGDALKEIYSGATATIFPGLEDFGLVPVESMACGTPVIAYRGGGALETMIEGETGAFFSPQNSEELAQILQSFDHKKYSEENCRKQALKFSRSEFEQQLHTKINALMAS